MILNREQSNKWTSPLEKGTYCMYVLSQLLTLNCCYSDENILSVHVQEAKALAILCGCARSFEPSLIANAIKPAGSVINK